MTNLKHGDITSRVLGAFYDVYNELGGGFLEVIYQRALARAVRDLGLQVDVEVPIQVFFRLDMIGQFYADMVVENRIVLEIKAVRSIKPEHEAQLIHYLRATAMEVGLLLNFGPRPEVKRLIYDNELKLGPRQIHSNR